MLDFYILGPLGPSFSKLCIHLLQKYDSDSTVTFLGFGFCQLLSWCHRALTVTKALVHFTTSIGIVRDIWQFGSLILESTPKKLKKHGGQLYIASRQPDAVGALDPFEWDSLRQESRLWTCKGILSSTSNTITLPYLRPKASLPRSTGDHDAFNSTRNK